MQRKIFASAIGLWLGGAAVACSVTNIEDPFDGVDAAVPVDATVPDTGTVVVPVSDGSAGGNDAAGDTAVTPVEAGLMDAGAGDARGNDGSMLGDAADASNASDASDASDAGDANAALDCALPATLHPPYDASTFCPFSAPFGQPAVYCAASDECCETPQEAGTVSTCIAKGSSCPVPGSTRWECDDSQNCAAGQVCCAVGADGGALGFQAADVCGNPFLTSFDGTRCMSACTGGSVQACEALASCASGTCTPLRARGAEIGICR